MPEAFVVNHIAFRCRDRLGQVEFFTRHFGFQVCRVYKRGTPSEIVMLKLGSVRLELSSPDPTKPQPAEARGGDQVVGFRHLAFSVSNLEQTVLTLQANGVAVDPIIDLSHIMPGYRVAFLRDPEGNNLELMENYQDEE